ncbi:low-complexity protein, putative [Babesia caballi]|uniref:Low-complexity protein, putative n=1 Tax=Babesia caballi TaxID=5871 RepID=A0AAV4LMT8_BABCB|nr:low-complexity protein, putative [Babesia caballi]
MTPPTQTPNQPVKLLALQLVQLALNVLHVVVNGRYHQLQPVKHNPLALTLSSAFTRRLVILISCSSIIKETCTCVANPRETYLQRRKLRQRLQELDIGRLDRVDDVSPRRESNVCDNVHSGVDLEHEVGQDDAGDVFRAHAKRDGRAADRLHDQGLEVPRRPDGVR